jgi:predicted nucleic acid-binding protein
MLTLDTNIIISYLNDEKTVVDKLLRWKERGEGFIISVVTEIETLILS